MKPKYLIIGASLITTVLTTSAGAGKTSKLGKVHFETSCDPKVQTLFDAHSNAAFLLVPLSRKTFEDVLKEDPGCAIAYWDCP